MKYRRQIVCGDIHGCIEEFDELLRTVQYVQGRDRLVLCGDLLDRGPDGVGVVRRCQEIGAESVMGNHDFNHLDWRVYVNSCKAKGKPATRRFAQERRDENAALSEQDIAWMTSLPYIIDLGNNWVVTHAGSQPNRSVWDEHPDMLMHMRFLDKETHRFVPIEIDPVLKEFKDPPNSIFWSSIWNGPESIIYGHAVHAEPGATTRNPTMDPPFEIFRDGWPCESKTLSLDTGCCFGGSLTAAISTDEFRTWEIASVQAKRTYKEIPGGMRRHDIPE